MINNGPRRSERARTVQYGSTSARASGTYARYVVPVIPYILHSRVIVGYRTGKNEPGTVRYYRYYYRTHLTYVLVLPVDSTREY